MKSQMAKKIARIIFIAASIGSLAFVPWILLKAWILPLPDSIQEQLEEGLGYGFEGIVVYVDRGGEAPEFYAAGLKDRTLKTPANPHDLFKIASVSKLYVAVAVAKLVHAERLSLDKTLAEYFPELAGRIAYADQITLRMMVQHRSGIPNFTDFPEFWSDPPANSEETLEIVLDQPANFKPGEDYGYSNTNYLIIRQLIEQTVGYDHFQFIKEEILVPLNLENTFGSLSEVDMDRVMSGYYVGEEEDFKTQEAGMLATAEDLGKFIRALNDGSVFAEGEQEIYSSIYEYEHTGLVVGYQTIAKYHEEIDTVVIQFTNVTDFQGYNWNLSEIIYGRVVKIIKRAMDT
ncbi:serine hydrolase domain-containing protein [Algoriphagus namhaensis]